MIIRLSAMPLLIKRGTCNALNTVCERVLFQNGQKRAKDMDNPLLFYRKVVL